MATDYDAFLGNIRGAAAQTRNVIGAGDVDRWAQAFQSIHPGGIGAPPSRTYSAGYNPWGHLSFTQYTPEATAMIRAGGVKKPQEQYATEMQQYGIGLREQAAIGSLQTQREALTGQAERAATALEMRGESAAEEMRRLEAIGGEFEAARGRTQDLWTEYTGKMEEYVETANRQTRESLGRLDELFEAIGKGRDFAKAHSAQALADSVLGSMDAELRDVARAYGKDSKEYQERVAVRGRTLAATSSQLQASYYAMEEETAKLHLNVTADVGTKMTQYESWARMYVSDAYKTSAIESGKYDLAGAQLSVDIARMVGTIYEDVANWIIQTPAFVMDLQPYANLMAELAGERAELARTSRYA